VLNGVDFLAIGDCTRWDEVFPNITTFVYKRRYAYADLSQKDLDYVEFLVSRMHMDGLENVQYKIGTDNELRSAKEKQANIVRLNEIFSGFYDLEEIVENGNAAKRQGGHAEERYWQSIQQYQRPCTANMKGE